jgi:hypothetical protein
VEPYYYRGEKGTNIGPLGFDELGRFHASGTISDSTMIIEVGSDKWERYDAVFSNIDTLPQAEEAWNPPELTVAEVALPQLPPLSAPRSGHCPMCSKQLEVTGDEFTDELLACPYCNTEAPAKDFIGSNEITTHGQPAPTGVPNGEELYMGKEKMVFGKVRILLWVLSIGISFGCFCNKFNPWEEGVVMERFVVGGGAPLPPNSLQKDYLVCFGFDRADKETAENKEFADLMGGMNYVAYIEYREVIGISYRNRKDRTSIYIGVIVPIILIVLTWVFEKPIVRKLEKLIS